MIELNLKMARELVEAFGGDEDAVMTLMTGDENSHSGTGIYVGCAEYPEEGSNYLGRADR